MIYSGFWIATGLSRGTHDVLCGVPRGLMETEVTKKLFTVAEYYQMANAGILGPEDRVELIEGEIIQMSPIGIRHASCVSRAIKLFMTTLGDRILLSPQNPV